jgi:hypothetical protein
VTHPRVTAILPSLDEPDTISAVTTAVDAALHHPGSLIVHADASATQATAAAFRATPTRARTLCLTGIPRGKGIQIRRALDHLDEDSTVLLADTDTANPDPTTYRALLDAIDAGAAIALADYQRFWDEGNLTNHVARPLIAAATGHDVPQPLAGDIAICATTVKTMAQRFAALPTEIARCVDGYGIDAFLLHTAAFTGGPVVSIRLNITKRHAPSFPHLPAIFTQAVPVLLHPAASNPAAAPQVGDFRLADRNLPRPQLAAMQAQLQALRPPGHRYPETAWPQALADAWRSTADGVPALAAAQWLWPTYLDRVHAWLAATNSMATRAATLRAACIAVLTVLTSTRKDLQ